MELGDVYLGIVDELVQKIRDTIDRVYYPKSDTAARLKARSRDEVIIDSLRAVYESQKFGNLIYIGFYQSDEDRALSVSATSRDCIISLQNILRDESGFELDFNSTVDIEEVCRVAESIGNNTSVDMFKIQYGNYEVF